MERLKALRRDMRLNQKELGARLGVKQNTVSQWESGARQADAAALLRMADLFRVSVDYLLGREAADWAEPLRRAYEQAGTRERREVCRLLGVAPVWPGAAPGWVCLPVYDDPAAAGTPLSASDAWETMEFPACQVPRGAKFGVRIRGHSMEPTISDGQIVFVRDQNEVGNGEVGIFMLDDGAVCKRLRLSPSGQAERLDSDNPDYAPIRGAALSGLRAVGKVLLPSQFHPHASFTGEREQEPEC